MRTSPRGIEDLVLSEGLETEAYRDSGGVWTIGVGHTAAAGPPAPKAGMKITVAEAKAIFARDLAKFEARVRKVLPNVPQHVFDGAVSFDFNTGKIHSASWPKLFKKGDMAGAERSLKQWNKDNGKVVQGLTNRRKHEADLIFREHYRSPPVGDPEVADVQQRLKNLGYFSVGEIDGIKGNKTLEALLAFKRENGLPLNDEIDEATLAALMKAKPRKVSPERANAGPEAVAGFETVKAAKATKAGVGAVGALTVAGGTLRELSPLIDGLNSSIVTYGLITTGVVVLGICGVLWYFQGRSEKSELAAYKSGEVS